MNELLSRIKQEKWHMTLDYVPVIDTFVCELAGKVCGQGKTAESAIIEAIERMDRA
ncbi:hypothetical protein M0R72_07195 [Candidatus Pacearchaeota archaeon]|jgi:hypothetical protein|nr:hypothetical protein [Candidatus Pacearchaeota archaeon]